MKKYTIDQTLILYIFFLFYLKWYNFLYRDNEKKFHHFIKYLKMNGNNHIFRNNCEISS